MCRRSVVAVAGAVLGVLLPVVAPSAAAATAATAQVEDDGLVFEARSVYRVEPAARRVRVAVDVTLTNVVPDRVVGDVTRYAFFDTVTLGIPDEAVGLAATTPDGQPLTVSVVPDDSAFAGAVVGLASDLRSGTTQSLRMAYELPDQPPRSEALTRVNPAFASVFAISAGDPGRSDVEVVVPPDYDDLESTGQLVERQLPTGETSFVADDIADPGRWSASVVARSDDRLARRTLEVSGRDVTIRAWPDDPEWGAFARRQVRRGLPRLEELIGRPERGPLRVTESVTPYAFGAGGWYSGEGEIEVGNRLDAEILLHELAHDWFNRDLFDERWISEGLAQEFASLAVADPPRAGPAPLPIDAADAGRVVLNDWEAPAVRDGTTEPVERYGYNAAWAVMRLVREEVGDERFRRVVTSALDDVSAYAGEERDPDGPATSSWRYLLDLFEGVAGSTSAAELFRAHVLAPGDVGTLEDRSAARDRYARLARSGDGWVPPAGVRRSMGLWTFDVAQQRMGEAEEVLEVRDRIRRQADGLGLDVPRRLELAYEAAGSDLTEVRRAAEALVGAGREVADAEEAVGTADGLWATVGSWGGGASDELAAARAAFENGDAGAANRSAMAAVAAVDDSESAGRRRAGFAALALLLLAVLVVVVRRRRRRPERPAAAPPAPGSDEGEGSAPGVEDRRVAEPLDLP